MRWIGARFADVTQAHRALADLRDVLDLGTFDADVAALGSTSYEGPRTDDVLLGGQFQEDRLDEVRSMIEHHGGRVVADDGA